MKQSTKDLWAIAFGILFLLAIVVGVGLSIWLHFFASCEHVDWMPVKDVPARCL